MSNTNNANVKNSNNVNTVKVSFTHYVNNTILQTKTQTLQEVADVLNVLAKKHNNKIKYTPSVVRAHVNYMLQHNKTYLSSVNLKLTKTTIVYKSKKQSAEVLTTTNN